MRPWAWWFVSLVFAPLAAAAAPIELESINPHLQLAVEPSDDGLKRLFQSLSLSPDGAYVALGRLDGRADIWSVRGGDSSGTLELSYREDRLALVAMLGAPCVAVTAVSERLNSKAPAPGASARPLELWSCASGERLGEVRLPDAGMPNYLIDLKAVPACGLVVASYSDRVVVVDVAARAAVQRLGRLFDGAREAALRTYPALERKGVEPAVQLTIAAIPDVERCLVYAAVQTYNERARDFLPAQIHEIDLRLERSRLAKDLKYAPQAIEGARLHSTRFTISPSGRYAAVSVRRPVDVRPAAGPAGIADLLIVDLERNGAVKVLDMRRLVTGIVSMEFVDEDVLLFTTEWATVSNEAVLFDWRTQKAHSVCSSNFGSSDGVKAHPRAMAVNARLGLMAVSLLDEVKVFRYRLNPKDRWERGGCHRR